MDKKIFKAYDIRGLFGKEIHLEDIESIFLAILDVFTPRTLSLAHDVRKENIALYEKVIDLSRKVEGLEVSLLGRVPTTIFYIYNKLKNIDIGIIFTASHNPKGYIGIKIVKRGESISSEDLKKIKDLAFEYHKKGLPQENIEEKNIFKEIPLEEILNTYFQYIISNLPKERENTSPRLHIIFDIASGSFSSPFIEEFLSKLSNRIDMKYDLINYIEDGGEFKAHLPDTANIYNYKDLIEKCKNSKTWGIGFDGDGDRILVVDPDGIVYPPEYIAYLISNYYGLRNILIEVSVSKYIIDLMKREGMDIRMIRTGHIFMEKYMREYEREIGVERSGHFYIKTKIYGYVEDAILVMVIFLSLLSDPVKREKIMKESKEHLSYFSDVEKVEFKGDFDVLKNEIKNYFTGCNFIEIDGIRVECDEQDFWFLIRKSNTEDIIRIIVESKGKGKVEKIKEKVFSFLN